MLIIIIHFAECVLKGRKALYEDQESSLVAKDDLPKSHLVSKNFSTELFHGV